MYNVPWIDDCGINMLYRYTLKNFSLFINCCSQFLYAMLFIDRKGISSSSINAGQLVYIYAGRTLAKVVS